MKIKPRIYTLNEGECVSKLRKIVNPNYERILSIPRLNDKQLKEVALKYKVTGIGL